MIASQKNWILLKHDITYTNMWWGEIQRDCTQEGSFALLINLIYYDCWSAEMPNHPYTIQIVEKKVRVQRNLRRIKKKVVFPLHPVFDPTQLNPVPIPRDVIGESSTKGSDEGSFVMVVLILPQQIYGPKISQQKKLFLKKKKKKKI